MALRISLVMSLIMPWTRSAATRVVQQRGMGLSSSLGAAAQNRAAVVRAVGRSRRWLRCGPSKLVKDAEGSTAQYHAGESTLDTAAWLSERVRSALVEAYGPEYADADPMLVPASRPEFGDYQCNVAMPLGKSLKSKPRDIAENIVARLRLEDVCEPIEIAGPGFLNIKLRMPFMQEQLRRMIADEARCAVPLAVPTQRVIVDYSSPNIAKEMHVGHLRSTIIGDSLSKVLEFRGHSVLRLNHVGDWGTQFGMLILHLKDKAPGALAGTDELDISDLVTFYKEAKVRFDADAEFQTSARAEVVKLQAGVEDSLKAWRMLCTQSEKAFNEVYGLLGVDKRLETRGESFYNPRLGRVIETLREASLLRESAGALCVFLDGYVNREGEPQPMIVQKSDGGFMYSTTDLAALAHRVRDERAERILYVTDAGQSQHFEQVFAIGRLASIVPSTVSLEHVPFGLVLGEDGKKFKTRSGETVKLMDLLSEAVRRAHTDLSTRITAEGRTEDADFVEHVSRTVGIGAVKYADLAMNRNSNYRFEYNKMLALNGNTAPFMLYAYARIRGIQRRAAEKLGAGALDTARLQASEIMLDAPTELALARHLLKLADVVREVESELLPSKLCEYIFELSGKFNQFYESCPVMQAESAQLQRSRLALCGLSASVLKTSLGLLGIDTLERL